MSPKNDYTQCPHCHQETLENRRDGSVHCINTECVPFATMPYEQFAALTPEQLESYRARVTANTKRVVVSDEDVEAILRRNAERAANRGINERLFG